MPTEQELQDLEQKARELFRRKQYADSEKLYLEVLEKLQLFNENIEFCKTRQRILNNILVGMYHRFQEGSDYDTPQNQNNFRRLLSEYLAVSEKLPLEERRSNAPNIVSDLYRYTLRLILKWNTEDDSVSVEDQEKSLRQEVRNLHDGFFEVFCQPGVFTYDILLDPSLDILYFERRNLLRLGHLRQNYYNTIWLCQVFLDVLQGAAWARMRSEILLLCSDVSLFLPLPPGLSRNRFAGEKVALDWLEKSLQEYPENPVARERRQQLISFLSSAEQINRFRHDVVSKVESIRGLLVRLQEKCSDDIRGELQAALTHVRSILGSFRLTMREKPSFRKVFPMHEWLKRFDAPDIEIHSKGIPRPVHADEDYLGIVLQNLIQNAREAYARQGISGESITLFFDYDSLELGVRDWAGGIPEDLRRTDKLFEPYASSKGIQQNAGLGLANVREACRLLNIEIQYEVIYTENKVVTFFQLNFKEPVRD
jgi:signal transduction histidine kinase